MSTQSTLISSQFIEMLWHNRLFDTSNLRLTDGRRIEILDPGNAVDRNEEQGDMSPEFLHASIRYTDADIVTHGHIKIDMRSSDFRASGLITHPSMSSVVLHVVAQHDMTLLRNDHPIPTLELKPESSTLELLDQLKRHGIRGGLCPRFLNQTPDIHRYNLLARLTSDRLERKSREVLAILDSVGGDWNECCYIQIIRSFGFRGQKTALEKLARSLPYRYIGQMEHRAEQIEAYLLGAAGYLNVQRPDDYTRQLQRTFSDFQRQYNLQAAPINWDAGTALRPVSAPVTQLIRIATLLFGSESLLESILKAPDIYHMIAIFDLNVPQYWHTHTRPSESSAYPLSYGMTLDKIHLVIINGVIPLLNAYGTALMLPELRERALDLYQAVTAETNSYTRMWSQGGIRIENGFESQAIIQLHSTYCIDQKCDCCPIAAAQIYEHYQCRQD